MRETADDPAVIALIEALDPAANVVSPPEPAAIERLVREVARARSRYLAVRWLAVAVWVVGFCWLSSFCFHTPASRMDRYLEKMSVGLTYSSIILLWHSSSVGSKLRKVSAELVEGAGQGYIGELIDGLRARSDDPKIRKEAIDLLTKVLPRLSADHAGLLQPRHHRLLNGMLAPEGENLFYRVRGTEASKLAILAAYQKIGGPGDIDAVKKLAGANTGASAAVKAAAAECLAHLTEAEARRKAGAELLRASGSVVAEDNLLRATSAAAREETALLRAAGGDG